MTDRRTLEGLLRGMRGDINLLERRLTRAGAVNLSGRIQPGDGIALEGAGTASSPLVVSATNMRRGTAAERAETESEYWDFWSDTDAGERLYVGDKSGGWRRFSGVGTEPAGAWSTTVVVSGSNVFAGRTVAATLPTVVLDNETVVVTTIGAGSGFGSAALATLTRNPGSTAVTIRHMQLAAVTQNALSYSWMIARQ